MSDSLRADAANRELTHKSWERALWLVTASVFAALLTFSGCSHSNAPDVAPERLPSFVARDEPSRCSMHCQRFAECFVRAALGVDPTLATGVVGGDAPSLRRLLRDCGDSLEGEIEVVSVSDFLKSQELGASDPAVLVHENGHLYIVLGLVEFDGRLAYQVVHGDSPVWLIGETQLEKAGFRETWQFTRIAQSYPIHVGSGVLSIDGLSRNFGKVLPEIDESCHFSFQNTGKTTVVLDTPKTSCGCVTTSIAKPTPMAPGESVDLVLGLNTGKSASLRHSVALQCFEKGTGKSCRTRLFVFASQQESMHVVPERLDFGTIVPGETVSRTVTLSEVSTDRFTVQAVDVGDLCLSSAFESYEEDDGLVVYRIGLTLAPEEAAAGSHAGMVVVATDSQQLPRVEIPVRYQVPSRVVAIPETISFGSATVGTVLSEQVRFLSRDGEALSVSVDAAPEGAVIDKEVGSDPSTLTVSCKIDEPGVWHDFLEVTVKGTSWEETLEIKCSAYAHEPSLRDARGLSAPRQSELNSD
jgi:hypothetical protein